MKSDVSTVPADLLGVLQNCFGATQASFAKGKTSVWEYAKPEHFNLLWKSLEGEATNDAGQVLILWSGTPVDKSLFPVNTVEHVSPIHWAACAVKKCSQITVCILDMNPTAHRGEYLYELYLGCDKRRLSWMRVVQAAYFFGDENVSAEFQLDPAPIEREALERRFFPQIQKNGGLVRAGHFVDRIRSKLTSPQNAENRHAISNILGPMVLRSGRALSGETSDVVFIKHGKKTDFSPVFQGTVDHRCALNSISRAAGLMCAQVSDDQAGARTPDDSTGWLALDHECEQAGLNPAELRITLVDDQWAQGWLAWLREGLGTTPVELQVSSDPLFLLQLLRDAGSENWQFRLSLDVLTDQKRSPKQDILLLDLRLFTGNPDAEREFLISLDALLNSLSTNRKVGVDRQDFEVVRRRLEALGGAGIELSGEDQARYVTILPRLMAQLDFSLPIILFSSTGQRDVERQFKNVPSIIADFSKPRYFQGADDDAVSRAENALAECVAQAICRLRGRKLVRQIQSRSLAQLEKLRTRCVGHSHFELYFDESGQSFSNRFRCAALLVGYKTMDGQPCDEDAVGVHVRMLNERLIWYSSSPNQVPNVHFLDKKQKNEPKTQTWLADTQWQEKVAKPLAMILGDRPAIPFVISRTPVASAPLDELDLAHPDALDNAFCDLLQLLIEVALVDVLPAIAGSADSLTLHVYGATRQKTILLRSHIKSEAIDEGQQLWRRFQDKYGFDAKDLVSWGEEEPLGSGNFHLKYRSLRSNAMLPLFVRSLAARPLSNHIKLVQKATKRAVAVVLSDRRQPEPHVRHQHYICDRLAHICDVDSRNENLIDLRILKNWEPFVEAGIGFLGRRNQTFMNLLDCGRFLDAKDLSSAFALGGAVLSVEGLFAESIARRLQDEVLNLSPDLFDQLCTSLVDNSAFEKRAIVSADAFGSGQSGIAPPLRAGRKPTSSVPRSSKQAFMPCVDAHVANDLAGCFDTKLPSGSKAENSNVKTITGPVTSKDSERIAGLWKICRFNNAEEYLAAGIPWHTMPGFSVRINQTRKITVFAELGKIGRCNMDLFIDPDNPNLFKATGELCGKEYRP